MLLAGLIQDGVTRGSSGFPGLSRIPVIGGLFGRQNTGQTAQRGDHPADADAGPRSAAKSRDLTDEYSRRFRAMEPLNRKPKQ